MTTNIKFMYQTYGTSFFCNIHNSLSKCLSYTWIHIIVLQSSRIFVQNFK